MLRRCLLAGVAPVQVGPWTEIAAPPRRHVSSRHRRRCRWPRIWCGVR